VNPTPVAVASVPPRLVSLDAYRGIIMLFMASAGFGFPQVAAEFPESGFWKFLAYHTSHAPWQWGGAWDMIQPAFMFMVGVALPYSLASRIRNGQSWNRQLLHTIWRSAVLVALAVFLASKNAKQTSFIFTNVLGQIGLGYTFLFLLAGRGWKIQLGALTGVAVLYWAAFAMHPLPPPDLDYGKLGVKKDELSACVLPGFFAHWNKNANFGHAFDLWFLNLFPGDKPFQFNAGGYVTLNFVPSLITMILGLLVGERLRGEGDLRAKLVWMLQVAAVCLVAGLLAGWAACPVIKRIWTPSWALYSGAIVTGLLAAIFWAVELRGWRKWTVPFVIVGMNSIAIYLMDQLLPGWIVQTLRTHLGQNIFTGTWGMTIQRCAVLVVLWLICWWMYRRKIFLRI
jgi:heparan-alpha-glucosaminide N-acetyltransferase